MSSVSSSHPDAPDPFANLRPPGAAPPAPDPLTPAILLSFVQDAVIGTDAVVGSHTVVGCAL